MIGAPISLSKVVAKLHRRQPDLTDYIEGVCDQIEQIEPLVQALLPEPDRRTRLLAEAAKLKLQFPDPLSHPALWGVPVGVKDLFRVDGFPTLAGSHLPAELFSGPEASFVSRLRQNGAIILGKTQMDEFAYCEPPPTRNPHNLKHTPGGSSGGSAAAVASGLCPLAIGTQTTRSIIGPAAFCGVVGFKPTYGRLPVDGIVMLSKSMDTIGFLTSDMPSLKLAVSILIQGWRDNNSAVARKPVLGVPQGLIQTYLLEEGRAGFQKHLSKLEKAGYELRQIKFFEDRDIEEIFLQAGNVLHGEMAQVHAEWFKQYEDRYRPRTASAIRRGQKISNEELEFGRETATLFRAKIVELMQKEGIDLWVTPASGGPAPKGYEVTGWGGQTLPWSFAGLPCLTLPAGYSANNLPLGLQLVAAPYQDEAMLEWAEELAKVFK